MSEHWPMFDIKRDNAIIEAGGFWCSACLSGKPAGEQSRDPRYCQGCYDGLMIEAKLLGRRAGNWRPKKGKRVAEPTTGSVVMVDNDVSSKNMDCDTVAHEGFPGRQGVTAIMQDTIRVLAGQGMSCRVIEKELLKENITVSYRTIARHLKGQGVLV